MKRFLIGFIFVAPAIILLFFFAQPQLDPIFQAPLFHFYVVTFTTFAAAVISILLGVALSEVAERHHFLAAIAFAAMGSIFFTHGVGTRGALIDYSHPIVRWSAWLTLLVGSFLFLLASLDQRRHSSVRRPLKTIVYTTAGSIFAYIIIAVFATDWLRYIDDHAQPWPQPIIFWATLGLWLVASFRLGQIWRATQSRIDGALCFVAFWMALATVSMHQFPVWRLSWWLYHIILLVGFLYTVYILLTQYERARQFRLVRYYLATSLILTVLLALIASHVFAQFLFRSLIARGDMAVVEPLVLSARLTGLMMAALTMGLLFMALLVVVKRADGIIQRRTAELNLAYSDLRRAEGLRDDLTNMIIHDLRNPLTVITGNLDLMHRFSAESQTDIRASSLAAARQAVGRLTSLINDMLTVSKMESGQLTPKVESIQVSALLKACLDSFATQAKAENKTLTFVCPSDLTAELDPALIGRVLDNLVSNALKYTQPRDLIEVEAFVRNGQTHVLVRDNGEGIPDTYKQQIFDKYFQAHDTNGQAKRQGTGLGLSFCRLAIQAHRGEIWVLDTPGGGSEFNFSIPGPELLR